MGIASETYFGLLLNISKVGSQNWAYFVRRREILKSDKDLKKRNLWPSIVLGFRPTTMITETTEQRDNQIEGSDLIILRIGRFRV